MAIIDICHRSICVISYLWHFMTHVLRCLWYTRHLMFNCSTTIVLSSGRCYIWKARMSVFVHTCFQLVWDLIQCLNRIFFVYIDMPWILLPFIIFRILACVFCCFWAIEHINAFFESMYYSPTNCCYTFACREFERIVYEKCFFFFSVREMPMLNH